jgi:multidrug efflux pump subunit AcrA (membrane-fusion protein)
MPVPRPRPEREPAAPQPVPVAPRPARPRRRWWLAVLILAAAGAGALYLRSLQVQPTTGGGPPVVTVPTAKVAMGDLVRTIRLAGTTAARNFAVLTAPQMRGGRGNAMSEVREISTGAGRRTQGGGGEGGGGGGGGPSFGGGGRGLQGANMTLTFLIAPGSQVKKGDIVAEFDREDMLNRLDDFKARVEQNEANLASVQAQLRVLETTHDKTIREAAADVDKAVLDLKTTPVRSAIDSERFRLALEEAQATYKQLRSEIPWMETSLQSQWKMALLARDEGLAELKRTQANVDRMVLRAPMDGLVVLMTTVRRGSSDQTQLKAGDQINSGMPIMRIVDLSSMIINATVNQVDGDSIRIGAKAQVHFDAFPDLTLPAEVYAISAMPRSSMFRPDYVKEVNIALRLLRTESRVLPDLSVSADVVLDTEPRALIAPREAIFRDQPDGKPFVFLQQPEGWVRREVELGKANHVAAAVRSGLREGDVVACERPRVRETGNKK